MELIVNPEGMFRLDFDAILEGAKRQQGLHASNIEEFAIAGAAHAFFDLHVLRLIRDNDWVYEAASRFAKQYSIECFRYLRTAAIEVYSVQKNLMAVNEKTRDILARIRLVGAVTAAGELDLVKASDFFSHVDTAKLDKPTLREAERHYQDARDHEDTQVWVTLRAIRDLYEILLPRVMFVVRRAMKVMDRSKPSSSDNRLSGISEYLDWYETKVSPSHALYSTLHKLRPFYRVARNVASHHEGFSWDPENNLIVLADKKDIVKIHIHEFQQNYRHLSYVCDLGLRGILSAYCGRDGGKSSDELVIQYSKTFPEDFPEGLPGRVQFYVQEGS